MIYFKKEPAEAEVTNLLSQVIKINSFDNRLVEFEEYNKMSEKDFLGYNNIPENNLPVDHGVKYSKKGFVNIGLGPDAEKLIDQVKDILGYHECTNALRYPEKSYMDWHTNSNVQGLRTYYVYNEKKGIFKYRNPDTGEIINDYDEPGWTKRSFFIHREHLLWHSVWSEGVRYAFGFNKNKK